VTIIAGDDVTTVVARRPYFRRFDYSSDLHGDGPRRSASQYWIIVSFPRRPPSSAAANLQRPASLSSSHRLTNCRVRPGIFFAALTVYAITARLS